MSLLPFILGLTTELNVPKPEKIDDDLIMKIGQDDMYAFEELYIKTERQLYSFVLSLCKNHDDALDIMQDTYMKIRASAHLYKPMGKPMAWIFTIARNLTMTNFKKKSRTADLEEYDIEDTLDLSYVTDPTDKIVLESALKILSEEEVQIILLFVVNGMKHKEIAESMDLKMNTVISKYNRGLKKLREYLIKEGIQ
ncbi:MAG: RNA polymerase sigma factor [Tissierellia bacterium]|jgi:RNA polymerase sigma factor (sigma-70 family)|nr:RNA polymerase sigma factor [Tissierellia bacterium]